MKEFLKKAALEIHDYEDFEEDPMNNFCSRYLHYWGCLFLFSLCLLVSLCDLVGSIFPGDKYLNKQVENVEGLETILRLVIDIDLVVQVLTLISGIYSQISLKVFGYKMHSALVVCAVFFSLPAIFFNKLYFIPFILLIYCYFSCKRLESTIYNSLVYVALKGIVEPGDQFQMISFYKETRHTHISDHTHADHAHLPSHQYRVPPHAN